MLQTAILAAQTLVPLAQAAATVNGSAVNCLPTSGGIYGPFEEGLLVMELGAATGTPTSFTVTLTLETSADGSTNWAAVTDLAIIEAANVVGSADNTIKTLAFSPAGCKQYVRGTAVVAFVDGTTPKVPVAVQVLLSKGTRIG